MNRSTYFDTIEARLTWLACRLDVRAKTNILNLHIHSENFCVSLLNNIFGWNLRNLNTLVQNTEAVDLVDDTNQILAQVSGTATKEKIESGLKKDLSAYDGYTFKFISISKDASAFRTKSLANKSGVKFSPTEDIIDVPSLLKAIAALPIDRQKDICELVERELSMDLEPEKVELNLTTIIKILSKENWNYEPVEIQTFPYDIPKKISLNELDLAESLIHEYKVHYPRIDKIYTEFDQQGSNRSLSILNGIRSNYTDLCSSGLSSDDCFFAIIKTVILRIRASANYEPIPDEELCMCVEILVVDAFVRCKIFKNPVEIVNANS